jgi:hypothetical protein
MIIRRTNGNNPAAAHADECFASAQRHHERALPRPAAATGAADPEKSPQSTPAGGDIIYGARAIALFIFGDDGNRARRRVFNLWAHYSARKERAGFFKLKGALCLSKAQWQAFHGLD